MADRIVVSGVKPYDGQYELDIENDPLTTLEWRWVKKISGYLPLTVSSGIEGGDADVFCAFAVIAMYREGKISKEQALEVADRLAEAPFGSAITFVTDEETVEDDAGPPGLSLATSEQQPPSEANSSSNENSNNSSPQSSGSGSPTSSDRSGNGRSPTGTGASGTSSLAPTEPVRANFGPLI